MSLPFPDAIPLAWAVLLDHALHQCAAAGFGRIERTADGRLEFEAFPGCEDAAADHIQRELLGAESGAA